MGFPGLILIGIAVSLLAGAIGRHTSSFIPHIIIQAPDNIFGWVILVFSFIGLAYLEESYFRFYLLKKLDKNILFTPLRVFFPAFLFAISHSWEGPWGMIYAFLAGIYLSALFLKYKTLHGISMAHACYNLFIIMVSITKFA